MLIFLCLFFVLLIISIVLKKFKVTVASTAGAIIYTVSFLLFLFGLRLNPSLAYPLGIATIIVVFVCLLALIPKLFTRILVGTILALPILFFAIIGETSTVKTNIGDHAYIAEFNKLSFGPVLISYYEEINPILYKSSPSFYAGYTNLVSWEKIEKAIEENNVGEFYTNPDDVYN